MTTRYTQRTFLFALGAMCMSQLFGCNVHPTFDPTIAAQFRAKTTAEFARGIYYKPKDHGMTGLEEALVPLIIEETQSNNPEKKAFICTPNETGGCDSGAATIYSAPAKVTIANQQYDQTLFLWFYHAIDEGLQVRGVRIVLGPDGFPMLWEALSPGSATRVFFVSRELEELATKQFGSPVSGRTFAIERATREAPRVVVARVLDDGPVVMGPWVYVGRGPARKIVTLLCRCMPSQVSELVATIGYDLQPVEAIPVGVHTAWIESLTAEEDLTGLLRWCDLGALAEDTADE